MSNLYDIRTSYLSQLSDLNLTSYILFYVIILNLCNRAIMYLIAALSNYVSQFIHMAKEICLIHEINNQTVDFMNYI